jgi:hypothetical protein
MKDIVHKCDSCKFSKDSSEYSPCTLCGNYLNFIDSNDLTDKQPFLRYLDEYRECPSCPNKCRVFSNGMIKGYFCNVCMKDYPIKGE